MTTWASPVGLRRRPRSRPAPATIQAGEAAEAVSLVSSAFTMIAIISLWFVFQVLVLSGFSQAREQHLLYGDFREQLASMTAPLGPVTPAGDPVALLTVPRLGLQQVVVEGTASGDLLAGPGHSRNTVLPGQQGVSLLLGRSRTYGAPFGSLTDLRAGDRIVSQTGQGRTVFTVDGLRVPGDPVRPVPAGAARLTLATSEGDGALGGLRAGQVVYLDATAAKGFPAAPGRPTAVPDSERVQASDPAALPMLALALALLAALTLAIASARQRWSAALVWVIASPVAIALSWFTTDVVMRLLPNLM